MISTNVTIAVIVFIIAITAIVMTGIICECVEHITCHRIDIAAKMSMENKYDSKSSNKKI